MRTLTLLTSFILTVIACKKPNRGELNQPPVFDSIPSPFMQRTVVQRTTTHKDSAWLQLPIYYNTNNTEKYPLVIYLNGKFESAQYGNLNNMLKIGVPKFMADSLRFAFDVEGVRHNMIVLCPQSDNGYPAPIVINQTIDYMIKNYRVDPSRVYLTAISSGAGSLLSYLTDKQEYANRIAAVVPMSSVQLTSQEIDNLKFIANAQLPTQIFCGNSDPLLDNNKNYVNEINRHRPGLATFQLYTGGHNNWNRMYDPSNNHYTPNIYQWMLRYRN